MKSVLLVAFTVAVLCCAPPASSQGVYASIYGTALDKSGGAIPEADVLVSNQQKGISLSVKTNSVGQYRVDNLVPDTYDVAVSAPGFKTSVVKGIHLNAGDAPKVDATLQVGEIVDAVTVTVGSEALLKTQTQDVSLTIPQETISSIPLQNRAANNLILLDPGASTYFGQWGIIPEIPQGGAWYNVAGQPQGSQDFTLDGTDNTDLMLGTIVINPAPESLQAVKIITGGYTADVGKANSAVLPMETKSGSNAYHGSLSDFRTSSRFLARNPYQAIQDRPNKLPPALNDQPEVNIGGPIVKNRLFFFFDRFSNRGRTGGSTLATVPTARLHNTCLGLAPTSTGVPGCDFGEYMLPIQQGGLGAAGVIYDANGVPYPGNVIPASQLSQPALNFLKRIPLPQATSGLVTNNYGISGTGVANTDQETVRIDYQVTAGTHVLGRYTYFRDRVQGASAFGDLEAGGPNIVGVGGISKGHNQSLSLGVDHLLSASLLTDMRIGYYRYRVDSVKFDQDQDTATQLGMLNLNNSKYANTGGSPALFIQGGAGMLFGTGLGINICNCPLNQLEEQFQVVNNWTKLATTHTFKFGADIRYGRQFRADSGTSRTGNLTFGPGPTSNNGVGGLGIATFMLGKVTNFSRAVSTIGNDAAENQKRAFFYGTDTWRIVPKLTLNYGLRWEIVFPEQVNGAGKGSYLDLDTGNLLVAGVGDVSLNMNSKTSWGNVAPRLGLSYQPRESSVIRAGYGRSFAMGSFGTLFGVASTSSLPVYAIQSLQASSVRASVFDLATGPPDYVFPTIPSSGVLPLPNGVSRTTRPNPLRLSTVDQWNVSFQQALTPTTTVTVTYTGNRGTNVWAGIFANINANQAFTVLPASLSVIGRTLYYDPSVSPNTPNPYNAAFPGIDANGHTSTTKYLLPYFAKYGWTQAINYNCNCSENKFHALQVRAEKRFSNGLSVNANYARQMTRDYDANYFAVDKDAVYGPENLSKKHVFNLYGFYRLPFGKQGRFLNNVPRWVDYIVGGYQVSPFITIQSGLPFSITYSNCAQNVPAGSPCFPNQNGSLETHLGPFDPATHSRTYFTASPVPLSAANPTYGPFSFPSLDQIGNARRNSFWGPGMWNVDLSLSKSVPFGEKVTAEFRMDAFNAFNHINPGNPVGSIDSPLGGKIVSMATNTTPRQLVFAAKVKF